MTSVLPKVKIYFFLSMICLLINLSIFTISLIDTTPNYENIRYENSQQKYEETQLLYRNETEEATLSKFATATGTSFIPFFNLIPLATIEDLPDEITIITGIIIGIISAFQFFMLSIIIINFVPKILGSGVDV